MGSPYVFLFFSSAVRHSISRVGQHGLLGSNYYSVHCTVVSMPSYSGGGGKIEIRTGEDKPPALLFPRFSGWEKCDGRGGGLGSHHQLFGYSIRDGESYGRLVDGTAGSQLQNGGTSAGYLLMATTFVFQSGKYNGSTLSMLGKNAVFDQVREMPIVGGSGLFRLSRGYALAHTHSFDPKTGNAVVEYNVTVLHY